jgi:hypothetical protein
MCSERTASTDPHVLDERKQGPERRCVEYVTRMCAAWLGAMRRVTCVVTHRVPSGASCRSS